MYGYLPIEWDFGETPSDGHGGEAPKDAGTIYIVDGDEDSDTFDEVILKTTLSEIVDYTIDGHIIRGKIRDDDSIVIFQKIQKALQLEIDKITTHLCIKGLEAQDKQK